MSDWIRVNRNLKCPICSSADWCMVSADGKAAICPRTKEGSIKMCGDSGYLHKLTDDKVIRMPKKKRRQKPVDIDWASMSMDYCRCGNLDKHMINLANHLGIENYTALDLFEVGWDGEAWTIPMYIVDIIGSLQIVGIKRRFPDGSKKAVSGSMNALFVPWAQQSNTLYIVEGFSDALTLADLHYSVIGKPNCFSWSKLIIPYIKEFKWKKVLLVSDNDEPGIKGNLKLEKDLEGIVKCGIVYPPEGIKDVRVWRKIDEEGLIRRLDKYGS